MREDVRMRSETEMMELLLAFANDDERIRVVGMEGSRTNVNVPKDMYQDYDISYIVTDMGSFICDESWLDVFGKRVMMQKPEAMEMFPSEYDWFSYLMVFEDGIKIDLSIIPLDKLTQYLSGDKLLKILVDKDGLVPDVPSPTDEDYWIYKPSAAFFDDCRNEFWFVSTYFLKGLLRDELLFASYHMEHIMRVQLFNMLSWKIGIDHGYGFSIGKNNKYIRKYLSEDEWDLLMKTYRMDSIENSWIALSAALELFRKASHRVAIELNYTYPDYDTQVTKFIDGYRGL